MAFTPLDTNTLKVGDPITSDILNLIRTNLDDHELRINSLATSGGTVFIFNGDISFVGFSLLNNDVFYYKARQTFSVNDFRVQLFTKQGLTSGNLVIDIEKSNDTNDSNFTSILTSDLTIDFSSADNYSTHVASLNSSENDILADQVLRIKVVGCPVGFSGRILATIGAQ
jgi:hypothetical protein